MNPVSAFVLLSGPSTVTTLSETYGIEIMAEPDIEIIEVYDIEIVEDPTDIEIIESIDIDIQTE